VKNTHVMTAIAFMLMLLMAPQASASAIYIYTGNNFGFVSVQGPTVPADPYTTGDRVSLVMELPAALQGNLDMVLVDPSTEPTSMVLLGTGLIGLVARRRRLQ